MRVGVRYGVGELFVTESLPLCGRHHRDGPGGLTFSVEAIAVFPCPISHLTKARYDANQEEEPTRNPARQSRRNHGSAQ